MKVSVVICTYSMDRYEVFCAAVDSVLEQTYDPIELVLVVDGNETVYERVVDEYGEVMGLVALEDIEEGGFFKRLIDQVQRFFTNLIGGWFD